MSEDAPKPVPPDEEREKRIAELESKLAKPSAVGVLPPVAAIALCGVVAVMYLQRDEVAYFFSSRQALDLGVEGAYRFDLAQSNRYAQVHGAPTVRGAYWVESGVTYVAVGVRETPLLVRRAAFATEDWKPGTTPPQPDQRPFTVKGRLLSRADAAKWEDAFKRHDEYGEVGAKWLLLAEQRPGGDASAIAWFGVLVLFAGVNLWLLVRGTIAFFARGRR